jgi:hypothetical protein
MPLRRYMTSLILQPVSLKKNKKRRRKAIYWLFMSIIAAVTYLLLYFAGMVRS